MASKEGQQLTDIFHTVLSYKSPEKVIFQLERKGVKGFLPLHVKFVIICNSDSYCRERALH